MNVPSRTVKPSTAKTLIKHCMERKRSIFVLGPPGIGKSDIIMQIGAELNRPVIDIRLLLLEPTDMRGIQFFNPETKMMDWAPPSELPHDPNSDAIVFLDEITAASPSMQASAFQLVLNRRIGTYTLPEKCSIVAAGNRETDRSVAYRMPSALSSRFVQLEMRHDHSDWEAWAISQNYDPSIIGYLRFKKEDLMRFEPSSASRSFPCPRTWSFINDLLSDELSHEMNTDLAVGCIGDAAGKTFMEHRKTLVNEDIPLPSDILAGRASRLKKELETSILYTLVTGLCYELKEAHKRDIEQNDGETTSAYYEQADTFLAFMMENFKPEFVVMGARVALGTMRLPFEPKRLRQFKAFSDRYENLILSRN